ncbi:MAG TPA: hypothetical protein VG291_20660 [Xanthobacteraceae bacterium]|nr:hypothetical protein [Xanthobacteraceae bacterium]
MSNFLIDEDTDLLAAEFVLGTLDAEERANAQSSLRTDHGFIAMVRIWERRFGELHLMVEPVEPEPKIWQRIKTKVAEIAASEPVPEGKSPTELTPSPEPVEAAGAPANADFAKPADAAAAGETLTPQIAPENGTAKPAEISSTAETGKPPEAPAAPDSVAPPAVVPTATATVSTAAEIPPSAEAQSRLEPPPELVAGFERGPIPKVAMPAAPQLPPPALKPPDKHSDQPEPQRSARRPEITLDVIRSRGRWRLLGVCMTLLVMGLVALLAAWRFVPDRLPAKLRPAQLMMSLGIQAPPDAAPAVKPAAPDSQFDE